MPAANHAFTRLDLLAVLIVVGALILVQIAGQGNTRTQSDVAVCLSNFHQLIRGWQLYADDNSGKLVPTTTDSLVNLAWVKGWEDWSTSPDNTNTLLLIDDRYAKLGRYVDRDATVFKCPADQFISAAQRLRGWTKRVRSVSGNIGIGDGNAASGLLAPIYKLIRRSSDFIYPGPSETWVYLEEHPDSLNDPAFANPQSSSWLDLPASYHNGAATFAFADGHAEIHLWQASLAIPRSQTIGTGFQPPLVRPGDPDLHWLSYRGGRNSTQSY